MKTLSLLAAMSLSVLGCSANTPLEICQSGGDCEPAIQQLPPCTDVAFSQRVCSAGRQLQQCQAADGSPRSDCALLGLHGTSEADAYSAVCVLSCE